MKKSGHINLLILILLISSFSALNAQPLPYSNLVNSDSTGLLPEDLIVLPNGDFVVTSDSCLFGPFPFDYSIKFGTVSGLTNQRKGSAFIAKFSSNGQIKWLSELEPVNTNGYIRLNAIAHDNQGNLIITGDARDTISFLGNITVFPNASNYSRTGYIAKLDSMGNLLWINEFIGPGPDEYHQVWETVVDGMGNAYITGDFNYTLDCGNGQVVTSFSGGSSFIAKFSPAGVCAWVERIGPGRNHPFALGLDGDDNLYFGTRLSNTMDLFGTTVTTSHYGWDAIIAKIDTSGTLLWHTHILDSLDTRVSGLDFAVAPSGEGWVLLQVASDSLVWNGVSTPLTHTGSGLLLANFDANGNLIRFRELPGGPALNFFFDYEVKIDPTGNVLIGISTTTTTIGLAPGIQVPGPNAYFSAVFDSTAQLINYYLADSAEGAAFCMDVAPDGSHLLLCASRMLQVGPYSHRFAGSVSIHVLKSVVNVGVESASELNFDVETFPSPSDGNFTVRLFSEKRQHVRLCLQTLQGVVVRKMELLLNKGSCVQYFEMSDLPGGIYFMCIDSPEGRFIQKIVISK